MMFAAAIFVAGTSALPRPALAQCQTCSCVSDEHAKLRGHIRDEHVDTKDYIEAQFDIFRENFFLRFFFAENLLAAMRGMAEQMTTNGLLQVMAVGTFLDAQNQMETQRLLQEMAAAAHRDYQPATEMCAIGGATRSLAASSFNSTLTSTVLSRRLRDRMLGHADTVAAGGPDYETRNRFHQLQLVYCKESDHAGEMKHICTVEKQQSSGGQGKAPRPLTRDRDIDYRHTVELPKTINLDFTNETIGNDEQDEQHVLALGAHLYAHQPPRFTDKQLFKNVDNHFLYVDLRSLAAKRDVAAYSFSEIVGMKTRGTQAAADITPFTAKFYEQMGLSQDDVKRLLGDRPSYHAQMDVLTRAIYQRPDFYINLYTSPANVSRIGASIRAVNLMQNMDRFKSGLRSEMLLSQILESRLRHVEDIVLRRIQPQSLPGIVRDLEGDGSSRDGGGP